MGRKYYINPETGEKVYIRDTVPSLKDIPKDVQINGTSILEDGVVNIPISNNLRRGVIAANAQLGYYVSSEFGDAFACGSYDYDTLKSKHISSFIGKGSFFNARANYVKDAMVSTTDPAWTADEQKAARNRIRAACDGDWEEVYRRTGTANGETLTVNFDACSKIIFGIKLDIGGTCGNYGVCYVYNSDGMTNNNSSEFGTLTESMSATYPMFAEIEFSSGEFVKFTRWHTSGAVPSIVTKGSHMVSMINGTLTPHKNVSKIITMPITGNYTIVVLGVKE